MQVIIRNKTQSVISVPVKDDNGILMAVNVKARHTYGPIDESRLTRQARKLASSRFITITNAS